MKNSPQISEVILRQLQISNLFEAHKRKIDRRNYQVLSMQLERRTPLTQLVYGNGKIIGDRRNYQVLSIQLERRKPLACALLHFLLCHCLSLRDLWWSMYVERLQGDTYKYLMLPIQLERWTPLTCTLLHFLLCHYLSLRGPMVEYVCGKTAGRQEEVLNASNTIRTMDTSHMHSLTFPTVSLPVTTWTYGGVCMWKDYRMTGRST
ncbi:hypothetical protein J6590_008875 [Homalodisca vitripennis]|nr:hypothetical protein J6590_008875 [Homalodisca vitripennis]